MGEHGASGPRMRLTLPGGDEVHAVVHRRGWDTSGWWFLVEVPLWSRAELPGGQTVAEPAPALCWAPASSCTPLEGEDYGLVPTLLPPRTTNWLLEDPVGGGPVVVHRGDCAAYEGVIRAALAEGVRQAVAVGAVPCSVCRPPEPRP